MSSPILFNYGSDRRFCSWCCLHSYVCCSR
ncbi:MAG: hypothetical protein D6706_03140 [Chloroflexi bacterium]|nr:MAG: hypothetical protein D6706_03140 [Chloroflexota bacterium]